MPMTNVVQLPSSLEACAKRINKLMENWTENTIELGRELKAARDMFPQQGKGISAQRKGWHAWIKKNIGIAPAYASSLIKVSDKYGQHRRLAGLSSEIMRMLVSSTTPKSAETEIISRIEKGERVSKRKAAKIIAEHKLPKPSEANKIAKDTGKAQLASDGYIYFGTSKEDAEAGENRRTIVYGVRGAIETLSEIEMSPLNFLKFMLPHQRWTHDEEYMIGKARKWLDGLAEEWKKWDDK